MIASRFRRAGILLLVLWLTGDTAAFGFCATRSLCPSDASTALGAVDDCGVPQSCCTGHHCFCCSSGAEVVTYDLSLVEHTMLVVSTPEPQAAVVALRTTSPPPKY